MIVTRESLVGEEKRLSATPPSTGRTIEAQAVSRFPRPVYRIPLPASGLPHPAPLAR